MVTLLVYPAKKRYHEKKLIVVIGLVELAYSIGSIMTISLHDVRDVIRIARSST
jgi:hypothetical protein